MLLGLQKSMLLGLQQSMLGNCWMFVVVSTRQVTDSSYLRFLESWPEENKPSVLLFDQMSDVPLLFKVNAGHTHTLTDCRHDIEKQNKG